MNRRKWIAEAVILVLVVLIGITSYAYISSTEEKVEKNQISVVVYGNSTDRWTAFSQGITQAAADFGAVVNFVTMSDSSDWHEQVDLLEREISNGAEGMVAAVSDSYRIGTALYQNGSMVPMVLVENTVEENQELTCIAADGRGMGAALARQILTEAPQAEQIWAVLMGTRRSSQSERLEGFQKAMKAAGKHVEVLDKADQASLERIVRDADTDVIAALEDEALELLIEAAAEANRPRIFGIGSTPDIVYALDRGIISGIVFQNEFNMGYEAVRCAVQKIRRNEGEESIVITYHEATKETLHRPENERLLYPLTE